MKSNLPGFKNGFKTNRIIAIIENKESSNRHKMISNIRLLIQNNLFPYKC